jgi:hypothetical protein
MATKLTLSTAKKGGNMTRIKQDKTRTK